MHSGGVSIRRLVIAAVLLGLLGGPFVRAATAQQQPAGDDALVQLDFNDVELPVVIETIAKLTGKNFIYDDRVRGRVTIVSPTRMTVDQAYAVFESVLQVKGFTTVKGPGGAIKVIPIREAKESSIETVESKRRPANRDHFITRLVPLEFIDAEAITNTLKPLVSKDASMVAYAPTNTIILTDSASNIRRILSILDSIDVETYREELAVIKLHHADAETLADQLGEIYGEQPNTLPTAVRARRVATQPVSTSPAGRNPPHIITDARTNSLIVLASRSRLDDIRKLVKRLDVSETGTGRIHVYYLKFADAEELAQTLSNLVNSQPSTPRPTGPRAATVTQQAVGGQIAELAGGITVTADVATNSLVIQGSKEAYQTVAAVIEKLDIPRPQVLVEALIMEISVGHNQDLGFNGLLKVVNGASSYTVGSLTDTPARPTVFAPAPAVTPSSGTGTGTGTTTMTPGAVVGQLTDSVLDNLIAAASHNTLSIDPETGSIVGGSLIQGVIRAAVNLAGTNIISAPHILTSDNEEAEIQVGNNIPIPTSRVQSAAGQETALATSVNIERQDIGVTLRVTPQITEGNTLRMEIFQEITDINPAATAATGDPTEVGVSLSNRQIQNVVVVADGETVVIGGLLADTYRDTVNKVPWLGDIPVLGWAFKSTSRELTKTNLLVFLTPHVIRRAEDLEYQSIRKREEFRRQSDEALRTDVQKPDELAADIKIDEYGLPISTKHEKNPARRRLGEIEAAYPLQRMLEIEKEQKARKQAGAEQAEKARHAPRYGVLVGTFADQAAASQLLQTLLDAGYEGTLASAAPDGKLTFEVHVGPYDDFDEASRAAEAIRGAYDVTPSVTAERGDGSAQP